MIILKVFFLMFAFSAQAAQVIRTKIHDIDHGKSKREPNLLFLESGHVLKIGDEKIDLDRTKTWEFLFDKNHRLLEINDAEDLNEYPVEQKFQNYSPTIIKSNKTAKAYFWESRVSRGETQCYNRAHVWAYELWKNHQVKSQKIFLFFSRKYIRERNFGWWFHVAPLLVVDEWSGKSEKVIDPRYINAPRSISWWTGKFVAGDLNCPEIQKYSDYADYPFSQDCYVLKTPMYIYQPLDMEMQEVWGIEKSNFVKEDLQWAYKEAFQIEFNGENL